MALKRIGSRFIDFTQYDVFTTYLEGFFLIQLNRPSKLFVNKTEELLMNSTKVYIGFTGYIF